MPADDSRDDFMPRPLNIMTYTYNCEGKDTTVTYSEPTTERATWKAKGGHKG
jgi:hypothetical protein